MHLKIVAEDLRKMRIGMRYKGYACVLIAAKLSLGKQGDPMYITKDLYPSIAEQTRLTQEAVESNITYVVQKCWENNRTYLREIAGYELERPPSNQEFIDILVNHALRAGEAAERI